MRLDSYKRRDSESRVCGVTAAFLAFNQVGEGSNPSGPS